MSDISASFLEYIKSVVLNWIWLLSAGPLTADKLLKLYFKERYEELANKLILPETRSRVPIYVGLFCFAIASFMAYNNIRAKAIAINGDVPNYEPLGQDQINHIAREMEGIKPKPTIIIGFDGGHGTGNMARQLASGFKLAHIDAAVARGDLDLDNERGLKMQVKDRFHLSEAQNRVLDALRRSKIEIELGQLSEDDAGNSFDVDIFVCPRVPKTF